MSGTIAFAAPWALLALALLPAIWWLLRVTPPPPQRVVYPALRFLADLIRRDQQPAQTPIWLMILRLILAALIILALGGPTLNPLAVSTASGPLLIILDDTFPAAPDWQDRLARLDQQLLAAERAQRPVVLATTAASLELTAFAPRSAGEMRGLIRAASPKPWGADRALAAKRLAPWLADPKTGGPVEIFWMCDGMDDTGRGELAQLLEKHGSIALAYGREDDQLGLAPSSGDLKLGVKILRTAPSSERAIGLKLMGDGGLIIKRQEVSLPADKASVPVAIDLPVDLTNRLQRIEIDAQGIGPSAGHVVLLDERARRRPVALVSGGTFEESQWLLSDLYYLERALSPYADVSIGTLEEALARQPALIILADPARIAGEVGQNLTRFIAQGGSVLRFAGPNLTADDNSTRREDPLVSASSDADHQNFLPAPLRQGDRALGGAMTWERPGHIAPFDADSPFAGLAIPDDVTINRQVLAEPSNDPSIRIWARLDDGTPLVTAQRRGQGWLAMVHVTATPDWSNLALSGLYVDMLRRVLSLSRISGGGGAADDISGLLKPTSLLDAFGNLGQPPLSAEALDAQALNSTSPGPRHPPGFYGEDAKRRALNTLPSDARWHAFVPPEKAIRIQAQAGSEIDLAPFLYLAALILLMADLLATLGLAGHLRRRSHAMIMVLAIAGLSALPGPDGFVANAGPINKMSAANESRLAYVRTGDRRVDALSQAGLHGLSEILARRTAFEPADPNAIDIEQDDLVFYPLLYWPVLPNAAPLSANAVAKVNAYMKGGGLILFDTRDGGSVPGIEQPAQTQLRLLLSSLEVPPLVRISTDHVLSKTFYLMQSFPGRWREGPIWVQATQMRRETADSRASLRPGLRGPVATNDGVSPVIIGAQDWAAAWAVDEHGNPMAAMVPDDPDQREMAYRFGVNVVMYALTGSYKSDQVHVPALLERLGQ